MPMFAPEPAPRHTPGSQTAVLLINLGTPQSPTAEAVRPYLAEFLSDPRVVELPKLLWQPLLRGLILPLRSRKSAHGYEKVWLPEGSPLAVHTARQAAALADRLPGITVRHAMTYGSPSVGDVIAELKAQGITRLLVIPLYPQYAASSSGAALDKVLHTLHQQRNMMALRTVHDFHNHPGYIAALARQIGSYWQQHGHSSHLLMSFHGIPQAHSDQGDPYPAQCRETARLLAAALGLDESAYTVSFQSRFGRAKWLEPSTQDLLVSLPKRGVETLDVVCPAFTADCLETMEEIALAGREQFHEAGGSRFHYIPCLNDNPDWMDALAALARSNLGGWQPETETQQSD